MHSCKPIGLICLCIDENVSVNNIYLHLILYLSHQAYKTPGAIFLYETGGKRCGKSVGAVRVKAAHKGEKNGNDEAESIGDVKYISPLFILPEFQNRGIGQSVIKKLFEQYADTITWKLDTIKQETGNCHLYEKCGFVRVGEEHIINENMTLIDYEKRSVGR